MLLVSFAGNLGQDAETKATNRGTTVLQLSVATRSGQRGDDGKNLTEWVRVSVFGKRGEALAKLGLTKGTRVFVSGELRPRIYSGRDGESRMSLDVVADQLELLGGGERRERAPAAAPAQAGSFDQSDFGDLGDDDDIPF